MVSSPMKRSKNRQYRKDSFLNKWCWGKWTITCNRMTLEHFLTSYTKINSKWIKDLYVRPETIKRLEENIDRTIFDIIIVLYFSYQSPRVKEIKANINK